MLEARSQWVGKAKTLALHALGTKQAISITRATRVGQYVLRDLDLDFANVYMACPT